MSVVSGRQSQSVVKKAIHKALRHDSLSAFDRLIEKTYGELRFISSPPLVVPVDELLDQPERERYVEVIRGLLQQYRGSLQPHVPAFVESHRFAGMARKVVGVGSVGTRDWVILMTGYEASDPLLLQVKEAKRSVLEPYAGPSRYESSGRRVVEGQRFMQTASDSLLGYYRLRTFDDEMHDFYVRQLRDGKSSIDVSRLSASGLAAYGDACGWTLARGHARSGDRVAIAAFLGQDEAFEQAVAEFAATNADVNERDYRALVEAIDAGRISAALGA
jgi:uncharacterized protein (DUF2252 family)